MPKTEKTFDPRARPLTWVSRHAGRIRPGGKVLDIACGHGRHTRYLLSLGYRVTAVDKDVSRLTPELRSDESPGPANRAGDERLTIIATDLEKSAWPFSAGQFDGIVVANYLYRPHFPHLIEALAEGGILIFDTFAVGNEEFGRPGNPDFLLKRGELLNAFSGDLSILAYEHVKTHDPRPAVRQRICAVKRIEAGP